MLPSDVGYGFRLHNNLYLYKDELSDGDDDAGDDDGSDVGSTKGA